MKSLYDQITIADASSDEIPSRKLTPEQQIEILLQIRILHCPCGSTQYEVLDEMFDLMAGSNIPSNCFPVLPVIAICCKKCFRLNLYAAKGFLRVE